MWCTGYPASTRTSLPFVPLCAHYCSNEVCFIFGHFCGLLKIYSLKAHVSNSITVNVITHVSTTVNDITMN